MPDMKKVIKGLECHTKVNCVECPYEDGWRIGTCPFGGTLLTDVISILKEQEARIERFNRFINGFSRNAIPVVRCKDCKYFDGEGCNNGNSICNQYVTKSDWYCADGERRSRNEQ